MDLGVIVQSDLKCAKHCAKVVGRANRVLGMIKRTFHNFSKEIIVKLYKCFVRPHLEYAVQAWRPHLRKDIELLEGVQRRATRMVVDIKGMGYEERLKLLGLTTLETRRTRGDLIEVYRIMKGFDDIDANKLFVRAGEYTRGHSLKLFKPGCRLDCRKFSFSHRVIDVWNGLPIEVINCNTVNGFKNKLDSFMISQGYI